MELLHHYKITGPTPRAVPFDSAPRDNDPDSYVYHLLTELHTMLAEYNLRDEWLGMVAGPCIDERDGTIDLVYNVRTVDGPYKGKFSADMVYSWRGETGLDTVRDVYRAQVSAIESAFPEIDVQDYDEWDV